MTLYQEEPEVRSKLEEMDIPLESLLTAVRRGAGGFASTTAFHPRSAAGTYLYLETTAGLRLEMVPRGWEYDEEDGQPRVYSPQSRVAIVVQTGDDNTGRTDAEEEPRTRHPKGRATRRKVAVNIGQLELFPYPPVDDQPDDGRLLTWVLLVAVVRDRVEAELCLPSRMSDDGRPCGSLDRIVLPAQDLGGGTPFGTQRPVDEGPDTDIDVEWKQ